MTEVGVVPMLIYKIIQLVRIRRKFIRNIAYRYTLKEL